MQSLMQSLVLSQLLPSAWRDAAHVCFTQWLPAALQSDSLEQAAPTAPGAGPRLLHTPAMQSLMQSLVLSQLLPSAWRDAAHLCLTQ